LVLAAGASSSARSPEEELQGLVRGSAEYYVEKYGAEFDRSRAERHRIPVADNWDIPWGGKGSPERGLDQLGSLGGGNHFIELQKCEDTGTLFVQVHTGSRGFGHGLATNYLEMAKDDRVERAEADITDIDLGYFTPDSRHFADYLNAVAAGGKYAILNRLIIFEQIADAFRTVFREDLELVYEISHNLVQAEDHSSYGDVWVHRKGATRAFPGGHPALAGTIWQDTGHPVPIQGSNRDYSYVLMPEAGAVKSGYSINHGAGRRMSRGEAMRQLDQRKIDEQYECDGILVNLDGHVPLDEAAQCYKSCEEVVSAVVAAGLARVEHTLWPLASIKGNEESAARAQQRERKGRDRSREKQRARSATPLARRRANADAGGTAGGARDFASKRSARPSPPCGGMPPQDRSRRRDVRAGGRVGCEQQARNAAMDCELGVFPYLKTLLSPGVTIAGEVWIVLATNRRGWLW
jgi:tRNA-splicing ligase RtcB